MDKFDYNSMLLRYFYTGLFYVLLPFVLLRLFVLGFRTPGYRNRVLQRFGFVPSFEAENVVWVHAVSAGETIAAVPLIKALKERHPTMEVVISTMTPTGAERAETLLNDKARHVYAPYDLPAIVGRFLDRVQPKMLIMIDTELWPNIIYHCHRRGVKMVLVNGRLSQRSARRYGWISSLTRMMMIRLTAIACQSEAIRERFLGLGCKQSQIIATGSIKFDLSMPDDLAERKQALQARIGQGRTRFIAASTHEGEEDQLLESYREAKKGCAGLLLILVPRHPERFEAVARLCQQREMVLVRHTSGESCTAETDVFLLDAMGELLYFYQVADFAFVGGSLVEVGGHNMIEAAAFDLPIIMGPHTFKVDDLRDQFVEAGGMLQVRNARELNQAVVNMCDSDYRAKMGRQAKIVVGNNEGGLERVLAMVEKHL